MTVVVKRIGGSHRLEGTWTGAGSANVFLSISAGRGAAPASVNRRVAAVRAFFEYLVMVGARTDNPVPSPRRGQGLRPKSRGLLGHLSPGMPAAASNHLGYDAGDPAGRGSGNSRNGSTPKTVTTVNGPVDIAVPPELGHLCGISSSGSL